MFGIGRTGHSTETVALKCLTVVVLICVLFILMLSLTTDGSDAYEGEQFSIDGITYEVINEDDVKEVTVIAADESITAYNGVSTVIYGDITYNVTSIAPSAFYGHKALTSVVIPKEYESIGNSAFYDCISLKTLTISEGFGQLDGYAFAFCTGLREVTVPITVNVSDNNFYSCFGIEKITFTPDTGIGYDYSDYENGNNYYLNTLQYQCRGALKTLILEEGIKYIGDYTFAGQLFDSVKLPSSLKKIGEYAFSGCPNLTSLEIPNGLTAIFGLAFSGCVRLTSIEIPDNVTFIGLSAFYSCTSLTTLNIGNNVTTMEWFAFYDCPIKELTIPISLSSSGYHAYPRFSPCVCLEKVTFTPGTGVGYDYGTSSIFNGDNYEYTPWYMSRYSLNTVIFEEGITHIGDRQLLDCYSVRSITLPGTLNSLGKSAFEGCYGIKELTIPITLNVVGNNEEPMLEGFTDLQKITFTKGTDGYGFNYGIDNDDSLTNYYGFTPWYLSNGSLTEAVFEEGITHIGRYAFMDCSSLSSVTFPSTLKDIDAFAFNMCFSLKSIALPDGIECIGDSSFFECRSIESLTVPTSVKYIGQCAFYGCSSLETIILPDNVEHIGMKAFDLCPGSKTTHIPYSFKGNGGGASAY